MSKPANGFSLIEMMVVIAVMGVMVALSVPAYNLWARSQSMHGAAQAIASEIQMVRARAMATGITQFLHFRTDLTEYHVHEGTRITTRFFLPRNVTYASGSGTGFSVGADGRPSNSSYIILKDGRGNRDTVSVQMSGLVIVR